MEVVGEVDRSLIDYTGRDSKAQAKKTLQKDVMKGGGGKGGAIAAVAAAAAAMKKEQEAQAENGESTNILTFFGRGPRLWSWSWSWLYGCAVLVSF